MEPLIDPNQLFAIGPAALLVCGAFVAGSFAVLALLPAIRSLRRDREAERYYERVVDRMEREAGSRRRSDGWAA